MAGQVVDTATAEEFMQQVLLKVSSDELASIARAAEAKAATFTALFGGGRVPTEDELRGGLRAMFGARRRAAALVDGVGAARLGGLVAELLAPGRPDARMEAFVDALGDGYADVSFEIAGELLHFTDPDSRWLWTRWMWDPRTETGALRLVTMDEFDLAGATPGATYLRVGEAVAFVAETARAVGFAPEARGTLGLDVFLACVYGIYMYTVLRMRMTQEFNHVVPDLPELARRLLGVWRIDRDVATTTG